MNKIIVSVFALAILITACNNEKKTGNTDKKDNAMMMDNSKPERNKKVVMSSMEAIQKGDIDGMVKDAAPGFVDYTDGSIPPVTNLDSLKGFIKMFTTAIEGYKPSNLMLVAEGDYVFAYATWSGTFKSDVMGIKATGKMVSFPDVDIFKFNEDGKITEHRSVQNTGAALMTFSMMK
ncbi:MAG: ester cyclase [Chitinophagaceae bacterium]|nr:ester cyclase [Chitinophagaceae bacterium]